MNRLASRVGILGIGSSLPDKVLNNYDLEKMVDTSDEWITKRTGISERRILDKGTPAYKLGIEAAQRALKDAGLEPDDIDLIIVTTETPDYLTPSTACRIQNGIGAERAAAFDLNAACSGFIYGMTVASQFISNGYYKYVLIIGCEGLSKVVDWEDRNTCVLFGDGAGAAVLGPVDEYGILATHIGAEGSSGQCITIPCCHMESTDIEKRGGKECRTLWIEGTEVFKFAVKILEQATNRVLNDAGITLEDVKLIIPHQANIRIIDSAAKRLGVSNDKLFKNIHKYGNISSASIPVALGEAVAEKRIQKGDNVVLVGFGGGLTWGAALIRWGK